MKILHIINDLTMGGGQNLLIGLTAIQKQNHDVTVVELKESLDPTVRKKIEASGVKVKSMTVSGSVYNPLLIFKLIPIIRLYNIVHVHLFPALYWAGFACLLSGKKVKMVYTEHSTTNKRRGNPILHASDYFIYQNCYDKIIACSDKALETFKDSYPKIRHSIAINNGADISKYSKAIPYTKQEVWGIPEDSFVVTMVARFMSMKRQDTIVKAIAKLPSNFHACFVGGLPEDIGLINIKNLASKINVDDRVHFLYIRSDVERILKTSDANIMSSEYEGLSLSSIEGMAAGKPFIATNVNGLREVVGGAGILFELENSDQLAEILQKLESDKEFYTSVSQNCLSRASQYDIHNMVNNYLKVYKDVIKCE